MWHDLFTDEEEAGGLMGLRRGYDRFFSDFPIRVNIGVKHRYLGEADGYIVKPIECGERRIVLHFHGGGYCFGSAERSLAYAIRLAVAADGNCFALDYRLAPEHPFPAQIEDGLAAWRMLREDFEASDIFFSGESAGAALALATAMRLRDAGEELPAGILVLSPFVDCTLQSDSIDRLDGEDPIIERDTLTYMATGYFQDNPPDNPLVSPVFGDFAGLPPLLIQAGRNEVLVDDAIRLDARARAAGTDVTCTLYDERLHIFSMFAFLPNAAAAMDEIAAFIRRVGEPAENMAEKMARPGGFEPPTS